MMKELFKAPGGHKAVFLDMDDTILADGVNTERAWRAACKQVARRLGKMTPDGLYAAIIRSGETYWRDPERHRKGRLNLAQARREVVRLAFSDLGLKDEEKADELADAYAREKNLAIAFFPGARETLRSLKDRGLRLALITNGSRETQRRKIERFALAGFFDHILVEEEFGVGKPDERIFQAALDKLNVAAPETWMVGDDLQRDIAGARKLGIYSIWVDWRGNGPPPSAPVQPDRIIRNIGELLI